MLRPPDKNEFPGTGPQGNGISPNMTSQAAWLRQLKSGGCTACHQLGNQATREIPEDLGPFPSSVAAWDRRIKSGQAGGNMDQGLNTLGRERALKVLADWTDRIAKGEVPQQTPSRPQGVERNVVITQWDWADPKAYLHDVVSTDRRNPTVNANGPRLWRSGAQCRLPCRSGSRAPSSSKVPLTVRDRDTPRTSTNVPQPSVYWGNEAIWTSRNNVHNPMFDEKGRVWITSRFDQSEPGVLPEGSQHPSAKLYPIENAGPAPRHLRSEDTEDHAHQHLFRHAPSDVCRRC